MQAVEGLGSGIKTVGQNKNHVDSLRVQDVVELIYDPNWRGKITKIMPRAN